MFGWSKRYIVLALLFLLVAAGCRREEPIPLPTPEATAAIPATPTTRPRPTDTPAPRLLGDLAGAPGLYPRLIGRSPAEGGELGIDQPLELYFDQPMDPAATAGALTFVDGDGQVVAGEISWPQPRILRFTPRGKLAPGAAYRIEIGEGARSAEGINLLEGLTLDIQTIGNLEITQVAPAPLAVDILSDSAITVIFNRPVVPLVINQDKKNLPNPLEINPPVEGNGDWVNTSVFVFRPTVPLIGRQTYTARVRADVVNAASTSGAQLLDDYTWEFTVIAPSINYLSLPDLTDYPESGFRHLPLNQTFRVYFNQPMDKPTTEAAISLASDRGAAGLQFSWNPLQTAVTFTPTRLLEAGSVYVLTVGDSARSTFGGQLREGLTWQATTVLPPQIVRSLPANDTTQTEFSSSFRLDFASPMRLSTLKGKVIFDPPTKGDPDGIYDPWSWQMTFWGLQPSTDYTVTILPGMGDPYGNTISEETVIRFRTAPFSPSAALQMHNTFALYRQGGSTAAWVAYRNAERLDFSLYRLSFRQFASIVTNGSAHTYRPAAGELVWSQAVDVSADVDIRAFKRFDLLTEAGGDLAPGFYFISLNGPNLPRPGTVHHDARPLMIGNANLTLKTTATEVMMWVTDLATGAPLANVPVALFDANGNVVTRGVTDQDGIYFRNRGLKLKTGWEGAYYATTESETILGAAFSNWTEGVNPFDFGIYTDFYTPPGQITTYAYTDRPLYRPGQTVHFKGIVRENDDLKYTVPTLERVWVEIYSFEGEVYKESLPINEIGSFSGSFNLDGEAVLGGYSISILNRQGGDWLGSTSFVVAEFRKPTFQVEVSAAKPDILVGDTVQVTVNAEFFAGGAVANADVTWYLNASGAIFTPPRELNRYGFDNNVYDGGESDFFTNLYYFEQIASGTGRTDADGSLTIEIPANLNRKNRTTRLSFEATVTDLAGNIVSNRTDILAHPSLIYGGIRPERRVAVAGELMVLDAIVVDWKGRPQPSVPVSVEIVERRWSSVQEEDANGRVIWRSTVEEIPVTTIGGLVTGANGRVAPSFTPPQGGVYRAYVVVEDRLGNESRTSTFFWVAGEEFVSWRRASDHGFDLIADRTDYRPGETAELLIASPFQGEATALVTIERGHIYRHEVIRLESNSTIYRIPVTGEMAPNIFVSVLIMKGVDETNPAPDFKLGMVQFTVERSEQELQVTIQPDKSQLGPQQTVNYTIQVRDNRGNPVQAELSLSLVDLAILSLMDFQQPSLLDHFYSNRWLGVQTALLLTHEMDSYNLELQEQIKGGGGGAGEFGVLAVRGDFKDTAYWSAQVMTDASGVARVSVRLPDNLTTWRMDARAVTADTRVGQGTNDIQTTLPLLINPQTPRFFVVGDEAAVGALIRNTTDRPFTVQAALQAEGVLIKSAAEQSADVPANGSVYISWEVVVDDVSRVDFVFTAEGGGFSDASRPVVGTLEGQGIPVYKYEAPETVGTAGQLLDGGVILESLALPIFPDYTPTQGEVTVEVAPSLAAAMTEGLTYLEHFPYECTEQIVSKFLPNVLTAKALRAADISDPTLEANLRAQVNTALQRLYSRQRSGGGWPWWDGARTDKLVTAYVVLGLYEAQQAGYDVRQEVIDSGLSYLSSNLGRSEEMISGRYQRNRQAFLLYVLARAGRKPTREINNLFENRQILDLSARALLGMAMAEIDSGDPRLETLQGDFISAAVASATGTHWEESQEDRDYWNWNTDTRTTAMVLSFMARTDAENPLVANAVRWLMAHRTAGRWNGTQETAWTLMGLTDWMVASGELAADFEYEVALNGELLGGGEANAATLRTPWQIQTAITKLFTDQLNRLAIGRSEGPGNLYYTAHMNIYLPVNEIQPLDSGIIVTRRYYRPDDFNNPITEAVQGETLLVRLTVVAPNALHNVIIDDWLPAGLEAIDSSLKTTQQLGQPDIGQAQEIFRGDFGSTGWGWWYFNHIQLRDEKVELSTDYLPRGTYEYVYLARAATPGTFNVIPPLAQEFYFPEVSGRGAGSTFTVLPPGSTIARQETAVAAEPERIQFATGAISAERIGRVEPGQTVVYLLRAGQGQTMTATALAPNSNVTLVIKTEGGRVLGESTADAPTWSGQLPADQDYRIELTAVGGQANYSLFVEIK